MKRRTLLAGLCAAPSAFAGAIGSGKWIAGGTGGITSALSATPDPEGDSNAL